jgi:TolA-binding protein
MSWSEHKDSSAELEALVELGRKQGGPYTRVDMEAGLALLSKRMSDARAREIRLKRLAPVALVLIGSIALLIAQPWSQPRSPELTYTLEGGVVLDGGYLRDLEGPGIALTFEEGTKFNLGEGARARLRSVTSAGACLGLESGSASFDVVPNAKHHWEVEVGPFLVQVKGTTFDINWDPQAEQFKLDLQKGKVVVTGPLSGGELTLQAGQQLVVDLGKGETKIKDTRVPEEAPTGAASVHDPLVSAPSPSVALAQQPSETRAPVAVKRDWASSLARGKWDEILHQAEQIGVTSVYSTATAEELFTLANAARYRHRTQLARDSLLALRQRFVQSARSIDALFLLGRVDESRGDLNAALSWYDKYLDRAPSGAYASEALGRKMTLIARLGPERAGPIAEQYLRQFPKGSYAGSARALLKAH